MLPAGSISAGLSCRFKGILTCPDKKLKNWQFGQTFETSLKEM